MRSIQRFTALMILISLALAPGGGVSVPGAAAAAELAAVVSDEIVDAPEWVVSGDEIGEKYGYAVASGDFDGDGDGDALVGAPRATGNVYREGRVFLYEGGPGSLNTLPDWSAGSGLQGANYGAALASAGDVNGDEIDDILIGANRYWDGYPEAADEEGLVELYYGALYGLGSVADWSFQGNQKNVELGYAVASAGDVDHDGYDDVIVGARWYTGTLFHEGAAFAFYGSRDGLAADPDWSAFGGQIGAGFGSDVASAGDLNGDGFDDVVVGAPHYDAPTAEGEIDDCGAIYVYYGTEDGLSETYGWMVIGEVPGGALGSSVAGVGDVNGDGYDDLLVGAPLADGVFDTEGLAYLYLGSPGAPRMAWSQRGGATYARFGFDLGGLGDVNGDGYDDIVVGAYWYPDDQPAEGRVFVFQGGPFGPEFLPSWWADGDKAEATFGYAVSTAGDVNRDNELDLIVGAPEFRAETLIVGRAFVYYGLELLELSIERVFLPVVIGLGP
jgi:hypothetical protein